MIWLQYSLHHLSIQCLSSHLELKPFLPTYDWIANFTLSSRMPLESLTAIIFPFHHQLTLPLPTETAKAFFPKIVFSCVTLTFVSCTCLQNGKGLLQTPTFSAVHVHVTWKSHKINIFLMILDFLPSPLSWCLIKGYIIIWLSGDRQIYGKMTYHLFFVGIQ